MSEQRPRRDPRDGSVETRVNRRGFLAAAGLTATGGRAGRCSRVGPRASPRRRRRAPPVGARVGRPGGRRVRAGARPRERALHVQLVRLHLPGEHRGVQGRATGSATSSTTSTTTTTTSSPSSRAAASGYDIAAPTAEYVPGMVEEGFVQKLDLVADPERQEHQPDLQEAVVGSHRRVPGPQGLRHDRHPVPQATCSRRCPRRGGSSTRWSRARPRGKTVFVDVARATSSSSRSRCSATRSTPSVQAELDEARQILLEVAPHILALDSNTYGDKMAARRGVADPRLDRSAGPGAGRPDTGQGRLRRPERGHAVLARHVGAARGRPAPERIATRGSTSSRSPRSRPRRRTTTSTRRANDAAQGVRQAGDPEPTRPSSRPTTHRQAGRRRRTCPGTPSDPTSGRSSSRRSAADPVRDDRRPMAASDGPPPGAARVGSAPA